MDTDNISRISFAKHNGLPKLSTWKQINDHTENISRISFAKHYGLSKSSTWKQINDRNR